MTVLNQNDIQRLTSLIEELKAGKDSKSNLDEFLALLRKGGATDEELSLWVKQAGFSSIDEFEKRRDQKNGQDTAIGILIAAGLGLLLALLLGKK